jgi:hypothetical protein
MNVPKLCNQLNLQPKLTVIWYILWPFKIVRYITVIWYILCMAIRKFSANLVHFPPFLVYCIAKTLATLFKLSRNLFARETQKK